MTNPNRISPKMTGFSPPTPPSTECPTCGARDPDRCESERGGYPHHHLHGSLAGTHLAHLTKDCCPDSWHTQPPSTGETERWRLFHGYELEILAACFGADYRSMGEGIRDESRMKVLLDQVQAERARRARIEQPPAHTPGEQPRPDPKDEDDRLCRTPTPEGRIEREREMLMSRAEMRDELREARHYRDVYKAGRDTALARAAEAERVASRLFEEAQGKLMMRVRAEAAETRLQALLESVEEHKRGRGNADNVYDTILYAAADPERTTDE